MLTLLAMLAFAANSILCRLALQPRLIDPATFTTVRAASGAAMLALAVFARGRRVDFSATDWRSPAALLAYIVFFSFAYRSLSAGTGALILFGAVQVTMFVAGLRGGERFSLISWTGLTMAVAGLIYLVSPGVTAPDPLGAAMMIVSGVAWGFYSLLGRGVADPLNVAARNFIYLVPPVLLVSLAFHSQYHASPHGVALAITSGAITSGIGYVIWYAALPGLTAVRAATVQLAVPAIAAFGGIVLLAEPVSPRLLVASVVTLGGVAIVLAQRSLRAQRS